MSAALSTKLLAALAGRRLIEEPVAIVVAHPDDETIGAGAVLPLFAHLTLVHVTDGAPRDLKDARAAGRADASAYAALRRDELTAALALAGCRADRVQLAVPDQQASLAMPAIVGQLAELLARRGIAAVLTHPYEGGHPDHDAVCLAVHRAAASCPFPPAIVEMAGYHAAPAGDWITGRFLGQEQGTVLALSPAERQRKCAMLDRFASQRRTLALFGTEEERFRPAPHYDFSAAPHPGPLHYERHHWGMTGERWRFLAAAVPA